MIVNQSGGGGSGGGEVWKCYHYSDSYTYNTSSSVKNSFVVKGNISKYNLSGYISFINSSGAELAIGHFSTGTHLSSADPDDKIYVNKSSSAGNTAAVCGSLNVLSVENGLNIVITSKANSYAYGSASVVTVTADVFYQEA